MLSYLSPTMSKYLQGQRAQVGGQEEEKVKKIDRKQSEQDREGKGELEGGRESDGNNY